MSEREIFVAALQKANEAERAAYLDSACGDNTTLRSGVEALLREHENLGSFIESPASALAAAGVVPDQTMPLNGAGPMSADQLGSGTLGDYRILQKIGRGGMGVVYETEQISLGRTVALKVLPFAAMLDKTQLARFRTKPGRPPRWITPMWSMSIRSAPSGESTMTRCSTLTVRPWAM